MLAPRAPDIIGLNPNRAGINTELPHEFPSPITLTVQDTECPIWRSTDSVETRLNSLDASMARLFFTPGHMGYRLRPVTPPFYA